MSQTFSHVRNFPMHSDACHDSESDCESDDPSDSPRQNDTQAINIDQDDLYAVSSQEGKR